MKPQIDRAYVTNTLIDLVRINSINPNLVTGAPGEKDIAKYVSSQLEELQLEVRTSEIAPGRFNVIGILRGTGGGKSLMLNAHMDTVGVDGMEDPFSAEIKDGKLYGRGAFDMKGSLAACIGALKSLADSGIQLAGDVILTAVADEEYTSIGTDEIVKEYSADAAIVTEPTGMKTCIAHKGFVWVDVEVFGKAAHGSRFRDGIDANLKMGKFLAALEKYGEELINRRPHPMVGPPSMHAAKLKGGTEWSMYAARSKVQIERRMIPGETEAQVLREVQEIIDRIAAGDPDFKAKVMPFFTRSGFEISAEAPVVKHLQRSAEQVTGSNPELMGEAFWMDSSILDIAGIPTVIFGPIGDGAHAAIEWVDIESVFQTSEILAQTAINFCGDH